ncbi:LOW QUALITY PROTEIN: gustatory receptor for sugar taste 43a-like [Anopheles nili]|uniref:LOW QUALITY PROTEIN: gustatory receptor for sugar taste 43a-like n=1 Tax=Anopheles nili TaxID=185578 RepID=UPI00237ACD31|nr:LOW QUALITY PROTEIN: gustatory receptor for sugar taste 43a-like [Anopheles nili]
MEISEPTKIVFYVSRIFGLAPYVIKRTSKGKIIDYKRNAFLIVYSLGLVFCLAGLTYKGIFFDVTSKKPIRMKTATSKVVTILDVSVVVSACICGTLSGIWGLQFVRELNQRLNEADEILSLYVRERNRGRQRRKGMLMLGLVSFIITGALSLDIWVWYRIADKIKNEYSDSSANVLGYFPFYCLYYILMMFHVLFAQAALGIGSRYRDLNIALCEMFPQCKFNSLPQLLLAGVLSYLLLHCLHLFTLILVNRVPHIDLSPISSINIETEKTLPIEITPRKGMANVLHGIQRKRNYSSKRIISDLAEIHASLSYGIVLVSKTFGIALLAVLGSCLLHLVATSYFLMVELVGDKDAVFAWIQALWLFIHIFRFLLTIEPCHITNVESNRTITIISSLRRSCKDPDMIESINMFWQQLVGSNFSFTACGLCTMDRRIITSYCGAIATYLVILIQFKEADDNSPKPPH